MSTKRKLVSKPNEEEISHLEQINEELLESLERCRGLLSACRTKLSIEPEPGASKDPPAAT
jgi:hypothetical protein